MAEARAARSQVVEEYVLDEVPPDARRSWVTPALILAGVVACIPALLFGYLLVSILPLPMAILASVIGYAVVGLGQTFSALRGQQVGRPLVMILRDSLGTLGSRVVVSAVIAFIGLVWFGIQTEITGAMFQEVFGGLGAAGWSVLLGVVMFVTAAVGFNMLDWMNRLAVPALIGMVVWGIWYVSRTLGLDGLHAYQPAAPQPLVVALALLIGLMSFMMISPADYTRYARTPRDAVIAVWVGVVPIGIFFAVGGAVMGVIAADLIPEAPYDISAALSRLGYPLIASLIVFLGAWTTNVGNAYIGGLGLANMLNLDVRGRLWATLLGGGIGTVLGAFGVLGALADVATITGIIAAPLLGIIVAEVLRGRPWREVPGFNPRGLVAWGAGAVVALLTGYFYDFFIYPVNASVVSCLVYWVLQSRTTVAASAGTTTGLAR